MKPESLSTQTQEEAADRCGVMFRDGSYHVVARTPIPALARIVSLNGLFVTAPNRFTVQVQEHLHVAPPLDLARDQRPDMYKWRYLNHSCDPNAFIDGLELIARRPIAPWEEITFDYETTEYELDEPFTCQCGRCDGRMVRGFAHLSAADRAARATYLAPHLRERLRA